VRKEDRVDDKVTLLKFDNRTTYYKRGKKRAAQGQGRMKKTGRG